MIRQAGTKITQRKAVIIIVGMMRRGELGDSDQATASGKRR
ncbi:MAG: hypothetical protein ABL962_20200 [Fimbriimonadaceae bacterium]